MSSLPPLSGTAETSLNNLRSLVHDCLGKHMYDAAIFFADKLVALSSAASQTKSGIEEEEEGKEVGGVEHAALADVYTLAQALFIDRQYRRCLQLLQRAEVIPKDVRFRYLAARCLASLKEWEECLDLLGGTDLGCDVPVRFPFESSNVSSQSPETSIDYLSAICLLRADVFDEMENFDRAVLWYKAALRADPMCFEAFARLVGRHKLTEKQEAQLVTEIQGQLPDGMGWLGSLYLCMSKQYNRGRHAEVESSLQMLEAPPLIQSPGTLHERASPEGHPKSRVTNEASTSDHANSSSRNVFNSNNKHEMNTRLGPIDELDGEEDTTDMTMAPSLNTVPSVSDQDRDNDYHEGNMNKKYRDNGSPQTLDTASTSKFEKPKRLINGWGLGYSHDVLACRAELLYQKNRFRECYSLTSSVIENDPFSESILPIHVASAVRLEKRNDLFQLAHVLVKAHPNKAMPWYIAGCYYYVTKQFTSARHYFGKATSLDRNFAPAWVAFAQAFACQDETDQALAAFRTASRLFPGLHSPVLGMGLEYMRMNNLPLAEQMLREAYKRCPTDPAIAHEMGTMAFRCGRYQEAVAWLEKSIECAGSDDDYNVESIEPTLVNLGHALRKLKRYSEAISVLTKALGVNTIAPGTYAALGYTYHLSDNFGEAIENYHKSLGLRSEDAFIATMLGIAIDDEERLAAAKILDDDEGV